MWIVDDLGVVSPWGSPSLRNRVGASIDGEAFATYAVANLGYIEITALARTTRIRLRPKIVSDKTLTGLLYWLFDQDDHHCTIAWLANVWKYELVYGRVASMQLVEAIHEGSVVSDADALVRPKTRRLADKAAGFLVDWEEVRRLAIGAAHSSSARHGLSLRFGGRWTISEFDTGNGQATVKCMGEGYPLYDCAWMRQPFDRSFSEFPDAEYGRFVTQSHREAVRLGRPIHEAVDANINWPRFGLLRTRYTRVIAPFSSGTKTLMLSAARIDARVDV